MKKKNSFFILSSILIGCVIFISMGWSIMSDHLAFNDLSFVVRPTKDVRITGVKVDTSYNSSSDWVDYNISSIHSSIHLPSSSSFISFQVQVTNIGSSSIGIYGINGLPEGLEYELVDYQLKDKICNDSLCNLGVQKMITIRIYCKDLSSFDGTIHLDFDFRVFHKITYTDFLIDTSSFPQEVIHGDPYSYTFSDVLQVLVKMGGADTLYTFVDGKLEVPSVTDDLEITYIPKKLATSFALDSWDTILDNLDSPTYKLGDEKDIVVEGFGTVTLRLVNKESPPECDDSNFSQSACGFVVEFKDILSLHGMNLTDTNVGGWPNSDMRRYLREEIYPVLPSDLQEAIASTRVISGQERDVLNNYSSLDKLYLFAPHELWENGLTDAINYEKAWKFTRQLDYYDTQDNTTDNQGAASKFYGSSKFVYWLRSANSNTNRTFYIAGSTGGWSDASAHYEYGVVPAFRLG